MTMRPIDINTAKAQRDLGILLSESASGEEWHEYALLFLRWYLRNNADMHVDDLWDAGLQAPKSPRALGAVFQHARRERWMTQRIAEGGIVARPSIRSNLQLKPVWRSLIHNVSY